MELFFIGLRNVFRNRRRSVLNIIALSIGISIMIIFTGWVRGYFTGFYASIINFETGDLAILNDKYLDEERRLPLDLGVPGYAALRERLASEKSVKDVTGRIDFAAKVGNGIDSIFMLGRAIDPDHEENVTVLPRYISAGEYLDKKQGVLLGKSFASKLGLSSGDTVYITAYDRYSVENFTDATLVGIFDFGYPAMDDNIVFTDLATADLLLGTKDEVTRLVVRLKDGYSPDSMVANLNNVILPKGYRAYDWKRFAEVAVSAVQADSGAAWMMAAIIYIFIIIGILNSMSMSVLERTQEIGALRAVGMRRSKLIEMFLYESIGIALIASVTGIIIAGSLAIFLQFVGFDFAAVMPKDIPIPFGEKFTADFRWYDFLIGALAGVASAVAGGIIPAFRSARIVIADALGTKSVR